MSGHAAHDVDLLALEDLLARLFLVGPVAGDTYSDHVRDARIQIDRDAGREARAVLQQRPAQATERGIGALLDVPRTIDRRVDVPTDLELVERHTYVGRMFDTALDESERHIDADGAGLRRICIAALNLVHELTDRVGSAPFDDGQHTPLGCGGWEPDVLVATGLRSLIDCQLPYRRQLGPREGKCDIAFADRRHPVPALALQPGGGRRGHLLAQHQHHGLEQRRETREPASPRRIDLAITVVGQFDPWDANLEEAIVLEEVQVSVALGPCIVDRVLTLSAAGRKATSGFEVDPDRQNPSRGVEIRAGHVPGS